MKTENKSLKLASLTRGFQRSFFSFFPFFFNLASWLRPLPVIQSFENTATMSQESYVENILRYPAEIKTLEIY